MTDKEAVEMMGSARNEIRDLRGTIARLAPKADAYDKLAIVLDLLPKRGEGAAPDLVWTLERRMAEVQAAIERDKQPATDATGEQ